MIIAWTIAGALAGWMAISILVYAVSKSPQPLLFQMAGAFIGGLAAYTIAGMV